MSFSGPESTGGVSPPPPLNPPPHVNIKEEDEMLALHVNQMEEDEEMLAILDRVFHPSNADKINPWRIGIPVDLGPAIALSQECDRRRQEARRERKLEQRREKAAQNRADRKLKAAESQSAAEDVASNEVQSVHEGTATTAPKRPRAAGSTPNKVQSGDGNPPPPPPALELEKQMLEKKEKRRRQWREYKRPPEASFEDFVLRDGGTELPSGAARDGAAKPWQVTLFPRRKKGDGSSTSAEKGRPPLGRVGRPPLTVDTDSIKALFGLHQEDAAKALGISVTALKRACRKLGVHRWPYMQSPSGPKVYPKGRKKSEPSRGQGAAAGSAAVSDVAAFSVFLQRSQEPARGAKPRRQAVLAIMEARRRTSMLFTKGKKQSDQGGQGAEAGGLPPHFHNSQVQHDMTRGWRLFSSRLAALEKRNKDRCTFRARDLRKVRANHRTTDS